MKMTKVALTVALLVSGQAFAMQRVEQLWTSGLAKATDGVKYVWANLQSKQVTAPVTTAAKPRLASLYAKGSTVTNWVINHTPAVIKNTLTNKRNLKIVGAALAVTAAGACLHWYTTPTKSKKA